MAESAQDAQEHSSENQLAEDETSAVVALVAGREASNNDEDTCSGMAGKGGQDEDAQEVSESGEKGQMRKDKVRLELHS